MSLRQLYMCRRCHCTATAMHYARCSTNTDLPKTGPSLPEYGSRIVDRHSNYACEQPVGFRIIIVLHDLTVVVVSSAPCQPEVQLAWGGEDQARNRRAEKPEAI